MTMTEQPTFATDPATRSYYDRRAPPSTIRGGWCTGEGLFADPRAAGLGRRRRSGGGLSSPPWPASIQRACSTSPAGPASSPRACRGYAVTALDQSCAGWSRSPSPGCRSPALALTGDAPSTGAVRRRRLRPGRSPATSTATCRRTRSGGVPGGGAPGGRRARGGRRRRPTRRRRRSSGRRGCSTTDHGTASTSATSPPRTLAAELGGEVLLDADWFVAARVVW